MTWEDKLAALQVLDFCTIRMRRPGSWYVALNGARVQSHGSSIRNLIGNGETVQAAVEQLWEETSQAEAVVIGSYTTGARKVRWSGSEWETLPA